MARLHGFMVLAAAAAMLACAHREWRPKFDPTCDCVVETAPKTAAAPAPIFHPTASLLDRALARLQPTPGSPDPTVTSFLTSPAIFDLHVDDALQALRPRAEAAANEAADAIEREAILELVQLRVVVGEAASNGDQPTAIVARAEMWARYDTTLRQMEDASRATARARLASSQKAIDSACEEVATYLLNDVDLPAPTKTLLVADRLSPFLRRREAEAREAMVASIVSAIVAAHRPRLVAAMHESP